MLHLSKVRVFAGAVLIAAVWFCGVSYGWTTPGSMMSTDNNGNYPLGCPMGGIGGGNFNFMPDGTYNTTWCYVAADAGAPATCYAFQKRGATVISATLQHAGNVTMSDTMYWPTVKVQYTLSTGFNDAIVLKCFSPIIAGDGIANENENSSLPIAIYTFRLTNNTANYDTAGIALSNGATSTIVKNTAGTRVIGIKNGTVCVMADTTKANAADSITCGNSTTGFTTTGLLNNGAAGYLAKRVVVAPNSTSTITFCVSWTNVANGYYRAYFTDAQVMATYGINNAASWETKVDNWHNKILNSNLPSWLTDLVINCCHPLNCMTDFTNTTSNGVAGTYGMAESMSSGNYGTNDQAYFAHFPLPLFLPQAAWSQVARMSGSEMASGVFGHLYGNTDPRSDVGAKFVMETYKDYQWTGNTAMLQARYANIKNAIAGYLSLDGTPAGDGLTDDNDQTTYDNPFSSGWTFPSKEYDNELFLSAIKAAIASAVVNGTPADTSAYHTDFVNTSAGFERANNATMANSGFWNASLTSSSGKTGYYTGSSNVAPGPTSYSIGTCVWNGALHGQWCADLCGLGPLHPESRIESSLDVMNDACLDQHNNPPHYTMMMAYANVNNTGATPTGTYFNGPFVEYASYGAGDFCAGFQHNRPAISMRALHSFWFETFSANFQRVYNVECKMITSGGASNDWGSDRYMNPPVCVAALFGITGFTIDVNAKVLRIKPSIPATGTTYAFPGDSLKAAPLLNPISCGTVDYRQVTASTPYQRFVIRFDNPMQFNTFYAKKLDAQVVSVLKPAVGGTSVAASIAVNSADTSEYQVTFGNTLTIDNTGVNIIIGLSTAAKLAQEGKISPVELTADMKHGTLSYVLPQRMKVNLVLVDARGAAVMRLESEEIAGQHVVRPEWKNMPAGVYYAHFTAGESSSVKKLVYMK
ncbi:MAG: GH116 family glycosyl hydrolase [Chitinispirillaceae bacterium]|jgi:parallel beta-helix repeat protein